jgi:carboxyl-terminal processing protease
MSGRGRRIALVVLAVTLAACTSADTGSTTTAPLESSGTAETAATGGTSRDQTTTTASTATTRGERAIEFVECEDAGEDIAIVCEAYDLIRDHYVDEVSDETLAEAATLGLAVLDGSDSADLLVCATPDEVFASVCETAGVAADDSVQAAEAMVSGMATYALDPNSGFLDAQSLDLLREEQQGEVEGIGALVSPEDQTLPGDNKQCGIISVTCEILIVSTIEGAPAETAGLLRDDEIVAVDGESILGWAVDEVTARVRGPAGSDVELTIDRDGEEFDVTITRAAVEIPVVEQDVFGDVGYVRLWNFTGNADSQFESTIVDVLSEGVEELVIDLRNNPGGFLTTAIEVTSLFLAEGDVVITEGPDESLEYGVTGSSIVPDDVEVTVVVNRGSASASEVFAGALQEAGRATVVGENTFGKNTVQQRFSLSNGGALKLTIARWLTPGGLDFGGTGVTPDVELDVNDLETDALVETVTGL